MVNLGNSLIFFMYNILKIVSDNTIKGYGNLDLRETMEHKGRQSLNGRLVEKF